MQLQMQNHFVKVFLIKMGLPPLALNIVALKNTIGYTILAILSHMMKKKIRFTPDVLLLFFMIFAYGSASKHAVHTRYNDANCTQILHQDIIA